MDGNGKLTLACSVFAAVFGLTLAGLVYSSTQYERGRNDAYDEIDRRSKKRSIDKIDAITEEES